MEADFSESKSSKTNWKHLILHQEHKDFSIGIKNKSWLAVASSKTGPFWGASSAFWGASGHREGAVLQEGPSTVGV